MNPLRELPDRNPRSPLPRSTWLTPTLDIPRRLLYVKTADNYSSRATEFSDTVLALDLASGNIVWSRQMTRGDAYNSACISVYATGRKYQLEAWVEQFGARRRHTITRNGVGLRER